MAAAGVAGAATMALAAPAMAAPEETVNPDPAHRGQQISVKLTHPCSAQAGSLRSTAFEEVRFSGSNTEVTATIKPDAELKKHSISENCPDFVRTHYVTVVPKGGAKTGIGGAGDGTDVALTGVGVTLILGAGGFMALRFRRGDAES
ncbi:hypothetical protein GCM10010191_39680 [Actinomadura vinacea]|uniref:LPXTG cell wall anchor domain-containing protein n=1 Tax=Actinomadura vinacea TaxID=115336 RepID=A0ABN3J770_9ACTN